MNKVILIGNSADCLKREMGKEIDTFDIVIRMNSATSKHFKNYGNQHVENLEELGKYVGTKTDILSTTGTSLTGVTVNVKLTETEISPSLADTDTVKSPIKSKAGILKALFLPRVI